MWERETRRRSSDRPRNREASTPGERWWYTRTVVASLMSTIGLRKLRPRCGLALSRGPEELALVAETRSASLESVVTWLILPVVICLSQRLSHACLSINKFVLWNCEWLIKSVIVYLMISFYMDNCGKLELIHATKAPTSGRGVFIR